MLETATNHNSMQGYDIIGDVHGHCSELVNLLTQMGYICNSNVWSHPERKAIFAGDFICRGPNSRGVLDIVRNMVDSGAAHAVLGNNELDVIGFLTCDKSGKPIYQPSTSSQTVIENVIKQFAGETFLLVNIVKWLRRLPFYLDLGSIRIAHAYWNPLHIQVIDENITKEKLTKRNLKEIFRKKTKFTFAVSRTTRGVILKMPKDMSVMDKQGIQRTQIRIKWWESPFDKTFRELSFGNKFILPPYTVPQQLIPSFRIYDEQEPLFFFGHYCVNHDESVPKKNICCVDSGIANSGHLTAYRWSGEDEVLEKNFVFEGKH